jgi:hypothetical protein
MTRKVTVSIPDMLHEKLEKWRNSFNMSKMFQDAIAEAIQKKEEFQRRMQGEENLSDIISRLKSEKRRSQKDYRDIGHQHGIQWAKSAHYDDLVYAVTWENVTSAANDSVLGSYFVEKLTEDRRTAIKENSPNDFAQAFVQGWKEGVMGILGPDQGPSIAPPRSPAHHLNLTFISMNRNAASRERTAPLKPCMAHDRKG